MDYSIVCLVSIPKESDQSIYKWLKMYVRITLPGLLIFEIESNYLS